MSKDIIIYQPWGGLGDNLQFSTLPRLYSDMGYNVYISSKNAYRNPEIYDLVWKLNPYVKGISNSPPNAGSCINFRVYQPENCMKNMELSHNLTNGNTKYPEIYYKPKHIEELNNVIIYDITSISSSYSNEFIISTFSSVFNKHPELKRKLVVFKNIKNRDVNLFNDEIIEINNIFEYCDIISSCKVFVSLFSGCSVLSSAIKQDKEYPIVYTFHHTPMQKGVIYYFNNINLNFSPIS
jgi:hypothetical protein